LKPDLTRADPREAIFGLREDLDLTTGNRYSFSASIFYLGYIVGAYPTMVLAQRYPVERVASILVMLWAICLILTVACSTYQGLYAQRFFLGVLESGISPLFMLIVVSIQNNSHPIQFSNYLYRGVGTRKTNKPLEWGKSYLPSKTTSTDRSQSLEFGTVALATYPYFRLLSTTDLDSSPTDLCHLGSICISSPDP
jgi:hypothetical protein